jgi:hypothetical protein
MNPGVLNHLCFFVLFVRFVASSSCPASQFEYPLT